MAMLTCQIVCPDKSLFTGSASSVTVVAISGEIGVLPGHASEICVLGTGVVRITVDTDETLRFVVMGGYAEIHHNTVTVLADHACKIEDIDVSAVEAGKAEAVQCLEEFAEGDSRRAYYETKIKWCDVLRSYV